MASRTAEPTTRTASAHTLAVQGIGQSGNDAKIASFALGELTVEARSTRDSLWLLIRRQGRGGVALRVAYVVGPFACEAVRP